MGYWWGEPGPADLGLPSGVLAVAASALGLPPELLVTGGGGEQKNLTSHHSEGLQI